MKRNTKTTTTEEQWKRIYQVEHHLNQPQQQEQLQSNLNVCSIHRTWYLHQPVKTAFKYTSHKTGNV